MAANNANNANNTQYSTATTIQALYLVNNPDSNTQQKFNEAQYYLEQLKSSSNDSFMIALQLISNPANNIQNSGINNNQVNPQFIESIIHFGLHCLEHLINTHWASLSQQQHHYLKEQILIIINNISNAPNNITYYSTKAIKQKTVKLLSDLALREWPQNWPNLTDQLFSMLSTNNNIIVLNEFIVLFFRNLSEQITAFNLHLPEQRKKEIHDALMHIIDKIMPFLLGNLENHYNSYTKASSDSEKSPYKSILTAILECLNSFCDFLPAKYIFSSNLLAALRSLLSQGAFFSLICDLLNNISGRKLDTIEAEYQPQLLSLLDSTCKTLESVLNSKPFAQQQDYLLVLSNILSNFTRFHVTLLQKITENGSTDLEQLKMRYLLLLLRLLNYSNPKVSNEALDNWIIVFRGDISKLISGDNQAHLAAELVKIIVIRLEKSPNSQFSQFGFDSGEEYNKFYGVYRGSLLILLGNLVHTVPIACFSIILERYKQLISSSERPTDNLNSQGFISMQTQRFLQFEAAGTVLESLFRAVSPDFYASSQQLQLISREILSLLVNYGAANSDPTIQTRRLHSFAYFTPLYAIDAQSLQVGLEQAISGLIYRSPAEENCNFNDFSEDTKACRRRAIHTLTAIAKKLAGRLVDAFDPLLNRIMQLFQQNLIVESEKVLIYEFLVLISMEIPNSAKQNEFISMVLKQPIDFWDSDQLNSLLSNQKSFLQLVGLDADEQKIVANYQNSRPEDIITGKTSARQLIKAQISGSAARNLRENIANTLNTFISVFKITCASTSASVFAVNPNQISAEANNPANSAFVSLLFRILPAVLRLLGCIYCLHCNDCAVLVPSHMKGLLASCSEHLFLLKNKATTAEIWLVLLNDIRHWTDRVTEACLILLTIVSRCGTQFYSKFPSQLLIETVFCHLNYSHNHELRFFLDKFISLVVSNCPAAHYSSVLQPILPGLLQIVNKRLQENWEIMEENKQSNNNSADNRAEALDIYQENELRELTRSVVDIFTKYCLTFDFLSDQSKSSQQTATPGHEHSLTDSQFIQYMFLRADIAKPALSTLVNVLTYPDTLAQQRVVRFFIRLLPVIPKVNSPDYYDLIGRELLTTALKLLSSIPYRPQLITSLETDLIELVKDIYQEIGLNSRQKSVRAVFLSIPGLPSEAAAELEAIEKGLAQTKADKKHKAVVKSFLARYIMGKTANSIDSMNNSAANISNLENKLYLQQTENKSAEEIDVDTAGLFR
jgi:hypothetical protein